MTCNSARAMRALFERHFLLPPLPTDIEIFSLAMG